MSNRIATGGLYLKFTGSQRRLRYIFRIRSTVQRLYSRDLYLEQRNKSLCNNKYEYAEQPEDLILDSVVRRFKYLVENYFETESATEALANKLNKCADASLKREGLCNFSVRSETA